jgi:hypothetical protein
LFVKCDNPSGESQIDITGTWYGVAIRQGTGYRADSFDIHLEISEFEYRMMRINVVQNCALPLPDSLKEVGTVERTFSDSVKFISYPDSCMSYNHGTKMWEVDYPRPFQIKIAIEDDSLWTADIPTIKDPERKHTTVMHRQLN